MPRKNYRERSAGGVLYHVLAVDDNGHYVWRMGNTILPNDQEGHPQVPKEDLDRVNGDIKKLGLKKTFAFGGTVFARMGGSSRTDNLRLLPLPHNGGGSKFFDQLLKEQLEAENKVLKEEHLAKGGKEEDYVPFKLEGDAWSAAKQDLINEWAEKYSVEKRGSTPQTYLPRSVEGEPIIEELTLIVDKSYCEPAGEAGSSGVRRPTQAPPITPLASGQSYFEAARAAARARMEQARKDREAKEGKPAEPVKEEKPTLEDAQS